MRTPNIKKLFSLAIAFFVAGATLNAQSTWKVDNAHSKITFSTVHNGISDVDGLFNSFNSTITASEEDFSDAVFELTIDVKSIDTEVDMRDDHLRSADFFEVEKYPTMTYKSTSIEPTGGKNHYKLTGELTMHGVTKTVIMDLWYRGKYTNPKNNSTSAGFEVTGTLKRSDFNIGEKFPSAMISDEVIIEADLEFIKQ
jgi:polyisoprenoid-binding protein YceI